MIRDGVLWERITLGLLTSGTEFGLWRTPTAHDWKNTGHCSQICLSDQVRPEQVKNEAKRSAMWPTIRAADGERGGRGDLIQAIRGNENSHYKLWPTPCASEARQGYQNRNNGKNGSQKSLSTVVIDAEKFATPQARDFRTGQQSRWENPERTRNLNDQIGGQLNPTWVEWLMGWPIEWTDSAHSGTDKFRQWCASHGKF
jgi:hypothetical protein